MIQSVFKCTLQNFLNDLWTSSLGFPLKIPDFSIIETSLQGTSLKCIG